MKKVIKKVLLFLLFLVILMIGAGFYFNEELPQELEGVSADGLTAKVQKALNQEAWDSTGVVRWSFAGTHHYLWNKKRHLVEAKWSNVRVVFNTQDLKGQAYRDDVRLFGNDEKELVDKAWKHFANDSFWLIAPYKLEDPGTERSLVLIEGDTCLKVTYTSGGVTPGDSYVWLLDDNYMPYAWKLWVKIIPVGGVKYGWNEWKTTATGAKIATLHKGLYDIEMTGVATGMKVEDIIESDNPFDTF